MNGLKSHSSQRGIGQWWMVLTIGLMVGFIFGFIVFLSRLPSESYTLVETERGIEQIENSDADQFVFYDRLSEKDSLVPNAAANELPAFTRSDSQGRYGALANERPSAVKIADELKVGAEVAPVELAAVSGGSSLASGGAFRSGSQAANTAANTAGREIDTATIVKRKTNTAFTFYYLQAGAFARVADADRRRRQLVQSGMDAFVTNAVIEGKRLYRVRLGPFYDSNSLGSAQNKLGNSGVSYLVVKVQKG